MKTISEVLPLSATFLNKRGIQQSRRIAEELLAASLRMKRMDLYLQFERPIIEEEMIVLRKLLKKCAKGEPLEYAIGEMEFYGCMITVDRRVLIPRPETEIMVDRIVQKISKFDLEGRVCWDICTGSGCIGIALKKFLPALDVTLADCSQEVLNLASLNAKANEVELTIVLGDLLEPFLTKNEKNADFVVCNPPYISSSEYLNLQSSVRDFEPKAALVGGERGTEFYERLADGLPSILNPRAHVFLEIGAGQGEEVKKIFAKGPWASAEVGKDFAGHDRFFFLEKQ